MNNNIDNTNTNMNMNMNKTMNFINETYDKLSYFDLYGNSVIIFIFATLFVFMVFSYCKVIQSKETIADDWINQRCKPQNILFAGLITGPKDSTAFQYTSENFQFCIQNILTNITGYALNPFYFMIDSIVKIFTELANSIQNIRESINRLRTNFREFAENILNRILDIMIPIQKMFISLMDVFQKIQGVMTSGLYTMLGSYYTLQSLMGAILELFIRMLVILVLIIVGLWVMPFTWPAASAMSAVFLAISIPLSIIIFFMKEVLHIKSSSLPKLRCFDEYTLISLENKDKIHIKNINVGDKLSNGSYVTAKIQVTSANLKIYQLGNIIVSESHLVKYNGKWIRVVEHPDAKEIIYNKEFLYCLNTSNKIMEIDGFVFSDWDEIIEDKLSILNKYNKNIKNVENIHEFLDDGFEENTIVMNKKIQEIMIGDILENDAFVYGIVEVETNKLRKYINKNVPNKNRPNKLYHLLTTDGNLIINTKNVKDYNNLIDKIII
jgi:hypothetical protein